VRAWWEVEATEGRIEQWVSGLRPRPAAADAHTADRSSPQAVVDLVEPPQRAPAHVAAAVLATAPAQHQRPAQSVPDPAAAAAAVDIATVADSEALIKLANRDSPSA
jgi:hypothetical protein